jgi:hypothetical protein
VRIIIILPITCLGGKSEIALIFVGLAKVASSNFKNPFKKIKDLTFFPGKCSLEA